MLTPLTTLLLTLPATLQAAESARPNVIVIIADDLGYGDVGCLSHGQMPPITPKGEDAK